jgi:GNAT superfamily N-acetyltransferase
MRAQDITAGMRLVALAGWNQTEDDWCFFLGTGDCFVAVRDDVVIGTVTTTRYGPRLAWIGMLLVDPAFRRQGIGTGLMQAAVDSLSGWPTIGLDATPAGRPLYERLGFRGEFGLVRMAVDCLPPGCLPPGGLPPGCLPPGGLPSLQGSPPGVRPVEDDDWHAIGELDRAALGADRLPLLRALKKRAPEAAWLSTRQGRVTGFCLGRHGSRFQQLGPVVARTSDEALALCRAGLAPWQGQPVIVDAPGRLGPGQDAFLGGLRGLGFAVQRPLTRMARGAPLARPESAGRTFAICGPEYG